jgi:hypothetical protein
MYRADLLNYLINKNNFKTYLEIGIYLPEINFNRINVKYKVGVDPAPLGVVNFLGTSDEYFDFIHKDTKFDLIFIDGLHHEEQVLMDIYNSLNHLSDNGIIVCHDCLPTSEIMQGREQCPNEWTGDVWKAIAKLRIQSTNLDIKVLDSDFGCGIIKRGINIPYPHDGGELTYDYYVKNKKELLNIISVEEFLNL